MEEDKDDSEVPISEAPSVAPSSSPKKPKSLVKVTPVPCLSRDLSALQRLFCAEEPPSHLVRGDLIHAVKYAFGDASKAGFGSSWVSGEGVKYRFGTWGIDRRSGSSNLR